MQVLPLLGSTLLLAGAGYAVFLALQHDPVTIPVIREQGAHLQGDASARKIGLAPNPRTEPYYTAITDRPLFEATRRPVSQEAAPEPEPEVEVEEVTAPAAPTEIPAPDIRLLGVLTGGARSSALISLAGDDPQWLGEGAQVDGWALSEIAPDHVLLTEKQRELRVELYQR